MKLPKFRNGSRWDWTTIPPTDYRSPGLWRTLSLWKHWIIPTHHTGVAVGAPNELVSHLQCNLHHMLILMNHLMWNSSASPLATNNLSPSLAILGHGEIHINTESWDISVTVSDEDASIVPPIISCQVLNITNARDIWGMLVNDNWRNQGLIESWYTLGFTAHSVESWIHLYILCCLQGFMQDQIIASHMF